MAAFYNEIDRLCCDWLQDLIDARLITPGKIDDRPVQELSPDDFRGYERVHFFAGIAGWDHALNLAGWRGPVWTGSCPCQPFSAAGKGKGAADDRHLWPYWFRFVRECRPATVFGEQVAAAIGRGWLDAVFADLEAQSYACASAVLPACGVGAPHLRQRVWFVADSGGNRREERINQCRVAPTSRQQGYSPKRSCSATWADLEWLPCTDGKARPVEPGTFPLAHGIPGRVGRLRAYGNAIVPQVAAEFIKAATEANND